MRFAWLALAACAARSPELVGALDRGDVAASRTLLEAGADPDAVDADGNSALMLATWHGDADLVRLAIAHHADVRHRNAAGDTALHMAVDDAAKVRALLDAGAAADAADARGITPLALAAARDDGAPVVELLLAHGADAKQIRGIGDPRAVPALLARGADARGPHVLLGAAGDGDVELVRALIAAGASVNARGGVVGLTPLMMAAQMGRPEAVSALLASGASPDAVETFNHSTALIQAAASDRADAAIVRALLEANADVRIADDEGATALDWAIRRGDPQIIQLIAAHEREPRPPRVYASPGERVGDANTPAAAMARAIPVLERSRAVFRKRSGCPSCHHDAFPALALAAAQTRGIAVDAAARAAEMKATVDALRPARARYAIGTGFADIVEPAYLLVGLAAGGHPRDDLTDAMTRYLELVQAKDGRWPTQMQRIPMDGSDVGFTAMAIRALAQYDHVPDRIARGRAYLARVEAATTEDRAFQLLGLRWAGAAAAELAPAAQKLVATQRGDGGFAQRDGLRSDAYATSEAIVALREAGDVPASDPAIQRAVHFLLTTQYKDGSWFVATRALRYQPWFDSGFPHGRSQYISAAATAWAVIALATL
jgi:ankyrin repeat protein